MALRNRLLPGSRSKRALPWARPGIRTEEREREHSQGAAAAHWGAAAAIEIQGRIQGYCWGCRGRLQGRGGGARTRPAGALSLPLGGSCSGSYVCYMCATCVRVLHRGVKASTLARCFHCPFQCTLPGEHPLRRCHHRVRVVPAVAVAAGPPERCLAVIASPSCDKDSRCQGMACCFALLACWPLGVRPASLDASSPRCQHRPSHVLQQYACGRGVLLSAACWWPAGYSEPLTMHGRRRFSGAVAAAIVRERNSRAIQWSLGTEDRCSMCSLLPSRDIHTCTEAHSTTVSEF